MGKLENKTKIKTEKKIIEINFLKKL